MAINRDDSAGLFPEATGCGQKTAAAPAGWLRLARSAGFAALLAAAGAGCSSVPQGVLGQVNVGADTPRVDMLTATTRMESSDAAELFTGDRGDKVSYNRIVVSIPRDRAVGTFQWPNATPGNPATDFVVASTTPIKRAQISNWLKSGKGKGKPRRVFVYIHGYNTPFGNAVLRFAQLVHDTDASALPVLFSWPSRGKLLDYKRDFDNASYSRSDLAELLTLAAASPHVSEIVVLAHSMGSWVAMEAVKQMALAQDGSPAKIRNLILASPDLDVGVFRRQIEDMGPRRPALTLFVSQEDRALQLSRLLARNGARLGAIDPTAQDYKDQLGNLPNVTVVDLTALRSGDRINHSLYAASPKVVQLIGDRLFANEMMGETPPQGPFAVVNTLGSVARLIVATPALVLDAAAPR